MFPNMPERIQLGPKDWRGGKLLFSSCSASVPVQPRVASHDMHFYIVCDEGELILNANMVVNTLQCYHSIRCNRKNGV